MKRVIGRLIGALCVLCAITALATGSAAALEPGSGMYTIDNAAYGIYSNGTHAAETMAGINQAMQDAKEAGYDGVVFPDGTYLIPSGMWGKTVSPPSDFTMDLGNAVLQAETNSDQAYFIISVHNVKNVTIKGGTIRGDKDTHDYSSGGSHEGGYGIDIRGGTNTVVDGVEIYNMTGDGIYTVSDHVTIKNCKIHDCRRQGISFCWGHYCEIANNEIYNISGTAPASGIDVEVHEGEDSGSTGVWNVTNGYQLKIHNNNIHDIENFCIVLYSGFGVEIYDNTLGTARWHGVWSIGGHGSDVLVSNITVHDNEFLDKGLTVSESTCNFTQYNNTFSGSGRCVDNSNKEPVYYVLFKVDDGISGAGNGAFITTRGWDSAFTGITAQVSGAEFPQIPKTLPAKGYEFAGWYDEDGNSITEFPDTITENHSYTAKFQLAPTVSSVTISPAAVAVQPGESHSFTAAVAGERNPTQAVTWRVDGASSAATTIDEQGVLSVGADETEMSFTVCAVAAADSARMGFATVTIRDAAFYVIENNKFGISNNNTNAAETTKGINEALQWAKEQGYAGAKLTDGTYAIAATGSINPPSDFTVDLDRAVLQEEVNQQKSYCMLDIGSKSNVTIKGGTLVGDRETHDYDTAGYHGSVGISLSGGTGNIIEGVTIRDMADAGISVCSDQVTIIGCMIYDCYNVGLYDCGGRYGEIAHNEIFNIGIGEGGNVKDCVYTENYTDTLAGYGLKIHDNYFHDARDNMSINKCFAVEVYHNRIENGSRMAFYIDPDAVNLHLHDNWVRDNGHSWVDGPAYNLVEENNTWIASPFHNNSDKTETYYVLFQAVGSGSFQNVHPITGMETGEKLTGVKGQVAGTAFPAVPTVLPDDGYAFDGWYDADGKQVTAFPTTIAEENQVYTAKFSLAPTVTAVTVTPNPVGMSAGGSKTFSATVTGERNPSPTVSWSVSGASSAKTGIDNTGKLTVGADETAKSLLIRARSEQDPTQTGTAVVFMTASPLYVIDNDKWGISADNTHAAETTKGIGDAMQWAKDNGYAGVTLTEGTYAISSTGSIAPPEYFRLDLGTAVLQEEPNTLTSYKIIDLTGKSYVTITGGTISGDSKEKGNRTATYGIYIEHCTGVTVDGTVIQDVPANGIYNYADRTTVIGCTVFDCGNVGINYIGGRYGEVSYNETYETGETKCMTGIYMGMSNRESLSGYGVKFHDNLLHDSGYGLFCHFSFETEIYNNKLYNDAWSAFYLASGAMNTYFHDNILSYCERSWIDGNAKNIVLENNTSINAPYSGSGNNTSAPYYVLFQAGDHGSFQNDHPTAGMETGEKLTGVKCQAAGAAFPAVPTVLPDDGYAFDGWYDADGKQVTAFPTTIPAENQVYTAKFKSTAGPISFSVDTLYLRGRWAGQVTEQLTVLDGATGVAADPATLTFEIVPGSAATWGCPGDCASVDSAGLLQVRQSGICEVEVSRGTQTARLTVVVPGDLDRNGSINTADCTKLMDLAVGDAEAKNEAEALLADLDGNGTINTADVTAIIDLAVGDTAIAA